MRILLLCNKPPWPPKDGGASATLNIIKTLSETNVAVTVLAMNTPKHFVSVKDIPEKISKSIEFHLVSIRIKVNPLRLLLNLLFSEKPYNTERYLSKKFCAELKKILINDFDLVQIEGLSMYHYLSVVRKICKCPVVFRPHNVENIIWSGLKMEEKNFLRKCYFMILAGRIKKLEHNIINEFDAIIPVCTDDHKWFINEGLIKPAIVASPGYRSDDLCPYSSSSPHKIFFIGALDWMPNINGLTWFVNEVWPCVIDKIPKAEFYIAGRNPSDRIVSKLRGKNIIFAGEVDSSSEFIKDKTLMVVPLFSGSGIRMKIIEGMSHGKCIVATPLAAKGLEYEDGKNIFISSDPSYFCNFIVRLLSDEDMRRNAGESAIENVRKNYNILATSEELIKFYREVIS